MNIAFLFRKYHKWLALLVGIQALIWCISGLYMTAVHIDIIHGDHLVNSAKSPVFLKGNINGLTEQQLAKLGPIKSIQLKQNSERPLYLIRTESGLVRIDAETLQPLSPIGERQIRAIAEGVYAGEANIQSVRLLNEFPGELGGRKQPIWQVQYDDWLASTLYFLPDTGELRSKRTDLWRLFDILWMLHIMDYDTREDINNNLLRFAASAGLLLIVSGIGLLFYSFKVQPSENTSILAIVKRVHKWIALLLGLQLLLWMVSGLMFSILSHKQVNGGYLLKPGEITPWQGNSKGFISIANRFDNVESISSGFLLNTPIYRVKKNNESILIDGNTLQPFKLTEANARAIALANYVGDGELLSIKKQTEKTLENRKFNLPVWQVNFSDNENSSLYLSAETGVVYGIKTDTWRLFDIFWMLHIMDYSERSDMNNSLVIFSVSVISFIALTGVWLIFSVFSLQDLNLLAKFKKVPVLIKSEHGTVRQIKARKNDCLYQALSTAGINLPSNCGGGGSCGLCRIKINSDYQVSDFDRELISENDLAIGYRLACQSRITKSIEVELPDQVLHQKAFYCRVVSNEFKTPLVKELVLEVPDNTDFNFAAGEYVLLHIPEGETQLNQLNIDPEHQNNWFQNGFYQYSSIRTQPIRRAYSMANRPSNNHLIRLNVRLALPETDEGESGKASSYLFALNKGELVKVSGAFGNFHASETENEMIFIGGGVGMAPLRSHILHQLKTLQTQRKISFWFGARNTQEIYYREEFDQLTMQHVNFEWHIGLSHLTDNETWSGLTGMIDQIIEKEYLSKHKDIQQCDFYICGPEAMNQAVLKMLTRLGVNEAQIRIDYFS